VTGVVIKARRAPCKPSRGVFAGDRGGAKERKSRGGEESYNLWGLLNLSVRLKKDKDT